MSAEQHPTFSQRRLYGRAKGKPLSARKQRLIREFLPQVSIPLPQSGVLDPAGLFEPAPAAVWLEIGFGKGEHLAWHAAQNPQIGMLGCEPFINGVAGLLADVEDQALDNVRILHDDAQLLLEVLPSESIDRCFILHGDPWPKSRHHKRRFIAPERLDLLANVLKPGAELRISTDHPSYLPWIVRHMANRPEFHWQAERPADWRIRPEDWPETRYEAKALKEGRVATYLSYHRR